MSNIKKVAVFTSGGDSPGMNACIRAVVRAGLYHGLHVIGIKRGYAGMIEGDFVEMNARSVSGIIHRGGTILGSARSEEFKTPEGMEKAFQNLRAAHIDAVVAIGGDGTFRGAKAFSNKYDIPFMGIPGTIDNDMSNTDVTIGFDTALNTVIDAIDKIKDTADAHDRLFFVEVMGRDSGFIALHSGIATGAEAILIPETPSNLPDLAKNLEDDRRRKKNSSIVIVAEGDEAGNAFEVSEKIRQLLNMKFNIRVTVLGHLQRGGPPTCNDRVLASRLGVAALEALFEGKRDMMAGLIKDVITFTPLELASNKININKNLLRINRILSI